MSYVNVVDAFEKKICGLGWDLGPQLTSCLPDLPGSASKKLPCHLSEPLQQLYNNNHSDLLVHVTPQGFGASFHC